MRTGIGYAPAAGSDGLAVLAGVERRGPGPSDREGPPEDPVARAVADAVLGASGLAGAAPPAGRDEGSRPSGMERLARAVRAAEGENYQVVNVDVTLLASGGACEAVGARRDEIRGALADRLHVAPGHVSLKSRRGAGPGGGDAAVLAVALVDRIPPMDQVHASLRAGG